jgi:hypothetical protein
MLFAIAFKVINILRINVGKEIKGLYSENYKILTKNKKKDT